MKGRTDDLGGFGRRRSPKKAANQTMNANSLSRPACWGNRADRIMQIPVIGKMAADDVTISHAARLRVSGFVSHTSAGRFARPTISNNFQLISIEGGSCSAKARSRSTRIQLNYFDFFGCSTISFLC